MIKCSFRNKGKLSCIFINILNSVLWQGMIKWNCKNSTENLPTINGTTRWRTLFGIRYKTEKVLGAIWQITFTSIKDIWKSAVNQTHSNKHYHKWEVAWTNLNKTIGSEDTSLSRGYFFVIHQDWKLAQIFQMETSAFVHIYDCLYQWEYKAPRVRE